LISFCAPRPGTDSAAFTIQSPWAASTASATSSFVSKWKYRALGDSGPLQNVSNRRAGEPALCERFSSTLENSRSSLMGSILFYFAT